MTSTNTIMISIRRRHLDHILKGIKRYELRRTCPKVNPPFRVLCCVCGTGGQVQAEFTVDAVACMTNTDELKVAEMACLTLDEVCGYKGDHELYGWRVAPRSPVDYRALGIERHITDYGLERPPQGWCYV